MRQVGAILHRGARASHYRGLSCCGAQAPDTQAQYLWLTGPVAPWHVGSSQTRARTRVPCIGISTTAPSGKPKALKFSTCIFFLVYRQWRQWNRVRGREENEVASFTPSGVLNPSKWAGLLDFQSCSSYL